MVNTQIALAGTPRDLSGYLPIVTLLASAYLGHGRSEQEHLYTHFLNQLWVFYERRPHKILAPVNYSPPIASPNFDPADDAAD